jgi:hypothetical protein
VSVSPENQTDSETKKSRSAASAKVALGVVGTIVRTICAIFAFILVVYVLFAVASANPTNWLVDFIGGAAQHLTLGLKGLFQTGNPDYQVIADYGVPAVVWLVIGSIVGRVLKRT